MRGLGLGFTNPGRTGREWFVCLCFHFGDVCGVDGEWVQAWARAWVWESWVLLCLSVL